MFSIGSFFVVQDGRPRNLGRGVSKPKKNTVASLLAQSRALGLKGTLPGELASQLAALKTPMTGEAFTSHLALLHNLAAMAEEDPDRKVSTPESAVSFPADEHCRTAIRQGRSNLINKKNHNWLSLGTNLGKTVDRPTFDCLSC